MLQIRLREEIMSNEPIKAGVARDHKLPKLQTMPGLSTQEEKKPTIVKSLTPQ